MKVWFVTRFKLSDGNSERAVDTVRSTVSAYGVSQFDGGRIAGRYDWTPDVGVWMTPLERYRVNAYIVGRYSVSL